MAASTYSFQLHNLGPNPLKVILHEVSGHFSDENGTVRTCAVLRLVSKGMSEAMCDFMPVFTLTFRQDDDNRRMTMYRDLLKKMIKIPSEMRVHLPLVTVEDVRRCLALINSFPAAWRHVRRLFVSISIDANTTSWMEFVAGYFSSVRFLGIRLVNFTGPLIVHDEIFWFRNLEHLNFMGQNKTSSIVFINLTSLRVQKLVIQRCTVIFLASMTLEVTDDFMLRACYVSRSLPQHLRASGRLYVIDTLFLRQPTDQIVFDPDAFLGVHTAHLGNDMATYFANHSASFRNVTYLVYFPNTTQTGTTVPSWETIFRYGTQNLERLTVYQMHNDQLNALTRLPGLRDLKIGLLEPDAPQALHAVVRQLTNLESLSFYFTRSSFTGPNLVYSSLCSYVASLRTTARASGIQKLTVCMFDYWDLSGIASHWETQEGVHFHTIHDGSP